MEKDVHSDSNLELPTIRSENTHSKLSRLVLGAVGVIVVCGGAYTLYNTQCLKGKRKLPPGPPPRTVFHTSMQSKRPCEALAKICSCDYGGIMTLRRGNFPSVLITSTAMATQILENYKLVFVQCQNIPCPCANKPPNGSQNLKCVLPYNGRQWHKLRQIYRDHVLSLATTLSFKPMNQLDIQLLLSSLDGERADDAGLAKPAGTSLRPHLCHAAFKLLFNICLGKRVEAIALGGHGSHKHPLVMQLEALFVGVIQLGPAFVVSDFVPPSSSCCALCAPIDTQRAAISATIEEVFLDVILEYKQRANVRVPGSEPVDVLDHLVSVQRDLQLHDQEMVWLLSELILANTDHVSAILEWTLAHLVQNSQWQAKLHEEINQTCGGKQTHIFSTSGFHHMPYLVATVKESIRVSSPIMLTVPHSTTKELKLGGFRLPMNTQIVCHLGALGQDPTVYKNPSCFDPHRYMGTDLNREKALEKQTNVVHLMAQQLGPGRGLEMLHVYIHLVKLLQSFEFSPLYGDIMSFKTSETVEWGVINVLKKPLVACLKPRL